MYRLPDTTEPHGFPDDFETTPEGLLAMGGNVLPVTLVEAYRKGLFPWSSEGEPVLWWHPNPRLVLYPDQIKISRSLKSSLKKSALIRSLSEISKAHEFHVSLNLNFQAVIESCAAVGKPGRDQTWITEDLKNSFIELNERGLAHSVEVWDQNQELVGGLYGLGLGKVFFGESMFSKVSDASKVALAHLCQIGQEKGLELIDCQVETDHLKSMGAVNISAKKFREILKKSVI
jgi:leucyl/phenylalanyl-tRNA--protein transferase